ncbi:transmembrane protein 214 isoform X1 [Leptinotarsa decemlineata]|uniref:transmembrane protein 214 isoform X1 n=1 Tax=Leptinotarsa decemlineata TaxID=7539 RepID=UPI003D307256
MSGQWEVVSKKKDRSSKLPVPKAGKTANPVNGLKQDEVVVALKSQAPGALGNSNDNKKNQSVNKSKEVKKRKERPQDKPKPPKSIESALNSIDAEYFQSIFDKTKNQFPDAPIVWLKELVYFLNKKLSLDVQDVLFLSKPQGYPLSIVPSEIKAVIEKALKEAGRSNTQLFFDICLSSMATDMAKGLPALGYKLFLQQIALSEPKLVTENLSKHVVLRVSYQNRLNIGLSILWCVGHVGYSDFNSGLSVFKDLFLPLIEMKSYSRFVLTYLLDLVTNNKDVTVTKEDFLLLVDTIYSTKKTLPVDLLQKLSGEVPKLKRFLFSNTKEKYNNYVEVVLKRIVANSSEPYRNCLCELLIDIFHKDQTTLASWGKVYGKTVVASAVLLEYIFNDWDTVSKKLNRNALKSVLDSFKSANDDLNLKKRKEDGLKASIVAIQKINDKMTAKKKSSFPLKTVILIISLAIGGLVYFDIKQHGTWKDSMTRSTLKEYRVCEFACLAVNKTKEGFGWVDGRFEEAFPEYHHVVRSVSEQYIELLVNLGKLARNGALNLKDAVVEQYPIVLQSIEAQVPGLIEQSQNAVSNVYSYSIHYFNRSIDFLRKEVFVGQLSPENVQKVVVDALNTTQQKAAEYYHWIYEKVQTSIR